ncbi:protein SICKLE [Mercurialis annua]|uniref:protein SICKLE n=1 Tax=Mercurialis annua TaxID=3986 RepID=UPI00215F7566|nr:protein SICKLE [Mercurialis annua]
MEDSEKRRERLKAMRADAAQAETEASTSPVSASLANPLLDNPTTFSSQQDSGAAPRFGFYTDPMAAFSANKRTSASNNQPSHGHFRPPSHIPQFSSPVPGPRNPNMTPSPTYQMQSNFSPNQEMHQIQGPYDSATHFGVPRPGPYPIHQRTPNAWNVPGDGAGYHYSAPYRGTTNPYPMHGGNQGFRPAGIPGLNYGQGRPPWRGTSPSPGSTQGSSFAHPERGRGQWRGSNRGPFSGRGGGRGQNFHSCGSTLDEAFRPESFYDKSMVEDPWQRLEPVMWRVSEVPGSSASWLLKSINMKKPKVSESFNNSISKQSLAEYLAASFNEAVKDASSV